MSSKKIELIHKVNLKKFTTIKIGGVADNFFVVHSLEGIVKIVRDFGFSFYILGNGSNLLIRDQMIKKPVIKLGKEFSYIKQTKDYLEIGASTLFPFVIKYCIERNLDGLINMAGIPASVGGLISVNASSFGKEISSFLDSVDVMDQSGRLVTLAKARINFGYRNLSERRHGKGNKETEGGKARFCLYQPQRNEAYYLPARRRS